MENAPCILYLVTFWATLVPCD